MLTITQLYTEPGSFFKISFEVTALIGKKLEEAINLYDLLPNGKEFTIYICTKKQLNEIEVKGPDIESTNIIWSLWLPYDKIVKEKEQIIPFLNICFEALVLLFNHYNVSEKDIMKIKEIIEKRVINNRVYLYIEEDIIEPDLSFLDDID